MKVFTVLGRVRKALKYKCTRDTFSHAKIEKDKLVVYDCRFNRFEISLAQPVFENIKDFSKFEISKSGGFIVWRDVDFYMDMKEAQELAETPVE